MSGNKIVWAGCCSWSHYIRNSVSQIASSKQKYFVSKLFREVTEPGWYSLRIDLSIARWRKWLLVIDFLFWSIFKLIYSEMSRTTTQEPRPASRAKQQCQHTPNSKIASNSFKRKIRSLPIRTGLSRSTLKSLTEETLMIFSWSFRTKFVMTITCTLSWGICALTASFDWSDHERIFNNVSFTTVERKVTELLAVVAQKDAHAFWYLAHSFEAKQEPLYRHLHGPIQCCGKYFPFYQRSLDNTFWIILAA